MSKKVTINGKEYQVYDGKGLPADNDVAILVIPLKKQVVEYDEKDKITKEKTGNKVSKTVYADTGFGSLPFPASDGTLLYSLEVKEAKNKQSIVTQVASI